MIEFEEALRLKPEDSKAHNDLGVALMEMGDPAGAIAELKPSYAAIPTTSTPTTISASP